MKLLRNENILGLEYLRWTFINGERRRKTDSLAID